MNYWQGGSGAEGRSYADVFIRMGIFAFDDRLDIKKKVKKMEKGDIFLLKEGMYVVRAVGRVVDDESYKNEYLQFDGWELTSYLKIEWSTPPEGKPKKVKGLKQGTLYSCDSVGLRKFADDALAEWKPVPEGEKLPLPNDIKEIKMEDVLSSLIRKGLRISDAERLSQAISHVKMLAQYYKEELGEKWDRITEDQVRAFLVLPLLLSVGWSEQCLALEFPIKTIKRGRVDVVGFDKPFHREGAKGELVIEVKKFSSGLDFAAEQAASYCSSNRLGEVKTICVTNGFRYRVFDRYQLKTPIAHFDLLHLLDRYPMDTSVGGAIEGLERLMPGHG